MNVLVKIVSVISSNVKETLGYEPLDLNVDLQEHSEHGVLIGK